MNVYEGDFVNAIRHGSGIMKYANGNVYTGEFVDNKIVTEENGVYTSGGANSYWNLLLHLVEKYTNRELAILASKFFVLDIDRKTQSPFSIFRGQKIHPVPDIIACHRCGLALAISLIIPQGRGDARKVNQQTPEYN